MPTPRKGETRKDFMSRCIPIVKKENPDTSNEQAAGKCGGIYDNNKNKSQNNYQLDDAERLEKFHAQWRQLAEDGVTESDTDKLKKFGKEINNATSTGFCESKT